ncbi:Holliday junction DNA helicase subunit RuvA [Alkalithermobacter thermoalcaliphilus JW-YL-7 = DSM 7308]|uniref:Holliday junction branch migration complex subunit RuvA n=1 Tax=Alkalithermobacter thermoalcaliphilus JW-YL-7 = DSM 7308 TaxID=1121328 RepID=A0A150FP40_CLOPD|nr:Holliday junction ATP-dependent DNA helicase ruvA [[Clostridium] paradoxum JW-YL-7 = DSM 7308]SHK52412.1 Holliday junction DNA helicase subunit RuvA [[Clostridium] paradoxum JW-YL-7 = DSM 7308]
MYRYIKGTVEEIGLDYVVIESFGIGYKINTSSNTIYNIKKGQSVKLYTRLIVKEDDMSICGFLTEEELSMFELLNSVSKIGPKLALGILSFAPVKQLGGFILSGDINSISKAPGVGKKTAERIVLELKDKIDKNNVEYEISLFSNETIQIDEAVEALIALGYSPKEAKNAADIVRKDSKNTEDLIKKALTYLMK